jgi:hypothetical protein
LSETFFVLFLFLLYFPACLGSSLLVSNDRTRNPKTNTTMTTITPANCPKSENASLVEFNDTAFQFSHGRSPKGRGSWIFCPYSRRNDNDYLDHCVATMGSTTFAEARKLAANYFAAAGVDSVSVCP